MSYNCMIEAFTRPPPPGRVGYRRRWINEPGRPPYWHFDETPEPPNDFALAVIVEQGIIDAYPDYEGTYPDLEWSPFYETWVYQATNVQEDGYFPDMDQGIFRALLFAHLGPRSWIDRQMQQRNQDYRNFLANYHTRMYRNVQKSNPFFST